MRGVIVYRSWWGSNRRIAEAIGRGLAGSGHQADVVSIDEAGEPDPSLDFVVVGAATRWPGAWPKIKRYAKKVLKAGPPGKPFAAFSTGGTLHTEKPNTQAADVLHELFEKGGFTPLAPPLRISIEGLAPARRRKEK